MDRTLGRDDTDARERSVTVLVTAFDHSSER